MRVIGAGLPRTGTSSLRDALALLLDGPVYHMRDALAHPEHTSTWVEAIAGAPPQWDRFLEGYVAGVDSPFSNCWRSVADTYPDAIVLLSRRHDADVWCDSMESTVLPRAEQVFARAGSDPVEPLFRAVFSHLFADLNDRRALVRDYEAWNRDVLDSVPPARLVVWQPEDGWDPLCRALGLRIPDVAFPHANSRQSYAASASRRAAKDRLRMRRYR